MPENKSTSDAAQRGPVPTPGQTIGPFYHFALPYEGGEHLVPPGSPGSVQLHGHVLDGHGVGLQDAMLEIWQADESGRVVQQVGSLTRDPATFTGFGRTSTWRDGGYSFTTVAPGATDGGGAPFIAVAVFARGLLNRLFTRVYLPAEPEALAADPFLSSLDEDRRVTLVATREAADSYRFDVHLQGEGETVFLQFARHEI
ncbi:MAG: protocatechuate 3,4-dioxygenase subunit alpha [Intrasporangium sp.]|uniref:protocatechuate 3,4-dioxygenase subunit alpha n=1 Tax=Intrasporangium sp. TaxID=1925024 RepID=UPI00264A05AC|nr:protocatechuate 3,4-dioxygenase subunit alpha [Intrasporangium sp.]MDN5796210.1 protocatechuate 3,4-dioxygenase subunit alpha [Intrasporangium sp.]